MEQSTAFLPERQFHLLINFDKTDHNVAVLPDRSGKFLVVDQGKVLGQMDFDRNFNCIAYQSELDAVTIAELNLKIKEHSQYIGLLYQ